MADTLIELTAETHLNLLLPTGEITRRMNQQRTTIDLTFTQQWITEKLIQCGVRKDLYYNSNHLPILTEISLKVIRKTPISRRAWKRINVEKLHEALQVQLPPPRRLENEEQVEEFAE